MDKVSYNDLIQVFGKTITKSIQNNKIPVFIGENIQTEDGSYKTEGYFLLLDGLHSVHAVTTQYGVRTKNGIVAVKQHRLFLHIKYDQFLPKRTEEIIDDIEFKPSPTGLLHISLVRFRKIIASCVINNINTNNFEDIKNYVYDAVNKHINVARCAKNEEEVEDR